MAGYPGEVGSCRAAPLAARPGEHRLIWGTLIATSLAGWLHQLVATNPGSTDTTTPNGTGEQAGPAQHSDDAPPDGADDDHDADEPTTAGLGVRGGKARIETCRTA